MNLSTGQVSLLQLGLENDQQKSFYDKVRSEYQNERLDLILFNRDSNVNKGASSSDATMSTPISVVSEANKDEEKKEVYVRREG